MIQNRKEELAHLTDTQKQIIIDYFSSFIEPFCQKFLLSSRTDELKKIAFSIMRSTTKVTASDFYQLINVYYPGDVHEKLRYSLILIKKFCDGLVDNNHILFKYTADPRLSNSNFFAQPKSDQDSAIQAAISYIISSELNKWLDQVEILYQLNENNHLKR